MNEVVDNIRGKNRERLEDYTNKVLDATKPIRNEIDALPKWDGAMVILVYCRMWNDFVTSINNVWFWYTHISSTDMMILKWNMEKTIDVLLYWDDEE